MKDCPTSWRNSARWLHNPTGPPSCEHVVFFETWGQEWRCRFDSILHQAQWNEGRDEFVQAACETLGLPAPANLRKRNIWASEQAAPCQKKVWSLSSLELPPLLKRDTLWSQTLGRAQLEFVVDNLNVVNIANSISHATNPHYRPPLDRIRMRLRQLYSCVFEYKAQFWIRSTGGPESLILEQTLWQIVCSAAQAILTRSLTTTCCKRRAIRQPFRFTVTGALPVEEAQQHTSSHSYKHQRKAFTGNSLEYAVLTWGAPPLLLVQRLRRWTWQLHS